MYDADEAAVLAIQAGCEILLMSDSLREALYGMTVAVNDGRITIARINENVRHIQELKLLYGIIN